MNINPSTGYANGQKVMLTATPAAGFVFGRWSGALNETANPATFTLNGPANITAEFLPRTGACTYELRPDRIRTTASSGYGRVDILTQSGCPWSVSQLPSWMTLNSTSAGNGPGYFSYALQQGNNLQAFVRVADKYLMVEKTKCLDLRAYISSLLPGSLQPARNLGIL